ncbi:hypothetical protein AURDEDRAFT_165854 [Auricularia subglabra TFB-10046 SS5]|nr:hypothetical protein AURDEDRAFT_165854 [Auricularia subglabra TFB-10046 SS5]
MFFDFDVHVPEPALGLPLPMASGKKDEKGKGRSQDEPDAKPPPSKPASSSSPKVCSTQLLEAGVLTPCQVGYTVLVLSQALRAPIDSRPHIEVPIALLPTLHPPLSVALAERLTLAQDIDPKSGFGLPQVNPALAEP